MNLISNAAKREVNKPALSNSLDSTDCWQRNIYWIFSTENIWHFCAWLNMLFVGTFIFVTINHQIFFLLVFFPFQIYKYFSNKKDLNCIYSIKKNFVLPNLRLLVLLRILTSTTGWQAWSWITNSERPIYSSLPFLTCLLLHTNYEGDLSLIDPQKATLSSATWRKLAIWAASSQLAFETSPPTSGFSVGLGTQAPVNICSLYNI